METKTRSRMNGTIILKIDNIKKRTKARTKYKRYFTMVRERII